MELPREKDAGVERERCIVCGAALTAGTVCDLCKRAGLNSQRYAELFWDEV